MYSDKHKNQWLDNYDWTWFNTKGGNGHRIVGSVGIFSCHKAEYPDMVGPSRMECLPSGYWTKNDTFCAST